MKGVFPNSAAGDQKSGAFRSTPQLQITSAMRVSARPPGIRLQGLSEKAFADMPNVGGRYGGAVTTAMFLKEFADPTPWVHLDIAGTAWLDDSKPFLAKGPTGVPLRTMVRLAMDWG